MIDVERHADERGHLARTYCEDEFRAHGLELRIVQRSTIFNPGDTLRGLHHQAPPNAEAKLVRCTRGAGFDVIVELRPGSRSRGGWFGLRLSAAEQRRSRRRAPRRTGRGTSARARRRGRPT